MKMNQYKDAWLYQAQMLLPPIISRIEDDGIPRYSQAKEAGSTLSKMRLATYNTTKAASKALVLSSIDGPLPILDVVALALRKIEQRLLPLQYSFTFWASLSESLDTSMECASNGLQ